VSREQRQVPYAELLRRFLSHGLPTNESIRVETRRRHQGQGFGGACPDGTSQHQPDGLAGCFTVALPLPNPIALALRDGGGRVRRHAVFHGRPGTGSASKGVSASDEVPVNLRAAGVSIEVTVGANGSVSRCTQIAAIALQRHRPEGPCDVECGRVAEPIDTDRVAATRAVSMSTKPALVVIQRSRAPCRPVR
jgi:hypothetical protein